MKRALFLILAILSLFSCSKSKTLPYVLPQNSLELLSGKSGKTWKLAWRYNNNIRMNMRGCFLTYRVTYHPNKVIKDNNGDQEDCGTSLIGNWEITSNKTKDPFIKITSDQLPEIMHIEKNYKFFKILKLSKDTLVLKFKHKQFSSESTFVDTFVPENTKVEDRDFHW